MNSSNINNENNGIAMIIATIAKAEIKIIATRPAISNDVILTSCI